MIEKGEKNGGRLGAVSGRLGTKQASKDGRWKIDGGRKRCDRLEKGEKIFN